MKKPVNIILALAAGFNLLGSLFMGSMEDIAAVFLLMGSCLDIDGIEAVTTLREKKETNDVAFEEGIYEWKEVGAAR